MDAQRFDQHVQKGLVSFEPHLRIFREDPRDKIFNHLQILLNRAVFHLPASVLASVPVMVLRQCSR
jgi:Golgi nucleoside diphosphatase